MKRVWLGMLLMALALARPAGAQVAWAKSFAAARQQAAQAGKPVLVDFYAPWCGPCKRMEQETFPDSTVRALMKRAVCVRVDIDREPALALRYEVQSIPRVLLLSAGGDETMLDLHGFHPAGEFAAELRQALGLKQTDVVLPVDESAELGKVREALQAKQYAALKAADPQGAAQGLDQLAATLGSVKEADLPAVLALMRNAGGDTVPALLRGMGHRLLAVRAGCFRTLQTLLREQKLEPGLAFDPWASPRARQAQLQRWTAWWSRKKP